MITKVEEQFYIFYQFSKSQNHWEEKYFLNPFVSRTIIEKGKFGQFCA